MKTVCFLLMNRIEEYVSPPSGPGAKTIDLRFIRSLPSANTLSRTPSSSIVKEVAQRFNFTKVASRPESACKNLLTSPSPDPLPASRDGESQTSSVRQPERTRTLRVSSTSGGGPRKRPGTAFDRIDLFGRATRCVDKGKKPGESYRRWQQSLITGYPSDSGNPNIWWCAWWCAPDT